MRLRIWLRWHLDISRRRYYREQPEQLLFHEFLGTVAAGPFRGMQYLPEASGSTLAPKLLGCYERELHRPLVDLLAKRPRVLVDIGSAEGYYAVGIPLIAGNSLAVSHAVDINPKALESVQRLAKLNCVESKVRVHQNEKQVLCEEIKEGGLVICDIEGAETNLLDPEIYPLLKTCDLIVEVHVDAAGYSSRAALEERFSQSHHCQWIPVEARHDGDSLESRWCRDPAFLRRATDEKRQNSCGWLILEAIGR